MTSHAFRVHGLHCAHEIHAIQSALEGRPGVTSLQFDLVARTCRILRPGRRRRSLRPNRCAGHARRALAARRGDTAGRHRATWSPVASGAPLLTALVVHVWEAGSLLHAFVDLEHDGPVHLWSMGLFGLARCSGWSRPFRRRRTPWRRDAST